MARRSQLGLLGAMVMALALLVPVGAAQAYDATYQRVSGYYASHGQTLPPCVFSDAELQDAKSQIDNKTDQYSPDFRQAIESAQQQRAAGACQSAGSAGGGSAPTGGGSSGSSPGGGGSGSTGSGAAPGVGGASSGSTSGGGSGAPSGASGGATARGPHTVTPVQRVVVRTPAPNEATPAALRAQRASLPLAPGGAGTPVALLVLAIAVGALALVALLAGVARLAGVDGPWTATSGSAWGELRWRLSAGGSALADRLPFRR